AGEEADVGRARIGRKAEREREVDRRAVGTPAVALKTVEREVADASRPECLSVRRPAALQRQHRIALAAVEEVAVERAERKDVRRVRRRVRRVGKCEKLDEYAVELDDAVLCPPDLRVQVARPHGEADALIERAGGIEVAHRLGDMIEAARHDGTGLRISELRHQAHFRPEKAVGTRNWLEILATIWPSR